MKPRHLSAATAIALLALLAGCSAKQSSGHARSSTTSVTTSVNPSGNSSTTLGSVPSTASGSPKSGQYVDAPAGTPRYLIELSSGPGTTIGGTLEFVYQDGRTAPTFHFTGSIEGSKIVLSTDGTPPNVSGEVTQTELVLDNCRSFLQYATSSASCQFTFSG